MMGNSKEKSVYETLKPLSQDQQSDARRALLCGSSIAAWRLEGFHQSGVPYQNYIELNDERPMYFSVRRMTSKHNEIV